MLLINHDAIRVYIYDMGLGDWAKDPEAGTAQGQAGGANYDREGVQVENNTWETLAKNKEEWVQGVDNVGEFQGRETVLSM